MSRPQRLDSIRRSLALALCILLTACQAPVTVLGASTMDKATASRLLADSTADQTPVTDTALRGRVDLPGLRSIQVTPDYAAYGATLTLVALTDYMTVVTGRTNTDGTFVLPLNGFTPAPDSYYLLESSHGLNNHAAGNQVARFRTYLRWTGSNWTSTSGPSIVINPQTTAVAIISSLDRLNVPPSGTIGKVTGGTINGSPSLTGHGDDEIASLATAISAYLTNDFDPVQNTPGLKPSVISLRPVNPYVGAAVMIQGSGFSPVLSGNTVLFGTATASIFSASPTTLGVFVPSNAPSSGVVTVRTGMGASTDNAAYTLSVAGAGGGSGGGSSGGLSISSLNPPNGAPGDSIMIRGSGFSSVATENVVKFSGVDATVTYADADSLIVTVPVGASSGALTVTVGGATKGFYFAFTVPIIASFSPGTGNQNTSVTVNGQNFSTQGPQSKIRFNGFPSPNITSWFNTQAVGLAPGPSLTNRITGPVTVITDGGIVSQSGGPFTARQNVIEDFSTTNQKHASTTATWGSSKLQPAAASTALSQSGAQFGSNTNTNAMSSAAGLTLISYNRAHTGVLPTYANFSQLGVDQTSYFISNGSSDPPTIYRYSLTDGSLLGSSARSGTDGLVYDRTNNNYLAHDYMAINTLRRYTNWNDASPAATGGNHSPFIATNGTYYFVSSSHNPGNILSTSFAGIYSWSVGAGGGQSAAGFAGNNTFLFNNGSSTISSLSTYTYPGGGSGTIAMPFSIGVPSGGNGYPLIGSDGIYLFVLGTNAAYNGGSNTLFRFAYNGATITPALYTTGVSATSLTSAIALPANSIWDALSLSLSKPAGTTATVDVLDGTTSAVLLSNVSNGQSLNGLTASSIKLRVTMSTTDAAQTPTLASWGVTTRSSYALSNGFDTGTNFGTYEAPTVTANNSSYTIQYSDSPDNSAWSAWTGNITTLSRRYVRYQVNITASNTQITRIDLPYTY